MTISIFCRLFGSQSFISDPIAPETMDVTSSVQPSYSVSSSVEPRYPKRKRVEVIYNEIDEDGAMVDGEAEEDYEPQTKVRY
jgi:hypothetical protein